MRRRDERGEALFWLIGLLVAVLLLGGLVFSVVNATHVEQRVCTVNDKDRTQNSDGSSDARVYTDECGTLHVADSLLSWTFSSSDTYASMKVGKTYQVTTRGYRIPFLSMFPNVVKAERVKADK